METILTIGMIVFGIGFIISFMGVLGIWKNYFSKEFDTHLFVITMMSQVVMGFLIILSLLFSIIF